MGHLARGGSNPSARIKFHRGGRRGVFGLPLATYPGNTPGHVSEHRVVTPGTRVVYELAGEEALRLWLVLRDASAEQLAEVERAAHDYLGEDVETIGREDLLERLASGEVVLIDVRPQEEFAAGHIEGARSIPLTELERRLAERLGYPTADLDRVPAAAIDSFAGVGYFPDLAAIEPEDVVLDCLGPRRASARGGGDGHRRQLVPTSFIYGLLHRRQAGAVGDLEA